LHFAVNPDGNDETNNGGNEGCPVKREADVPEREKGKRLPTTSFPNQGVWLSAASALAAAGLFVIVMSLVTAVFWSSQFAILAGILAGWIAASLYGGGSVLNYLLLRLWLTWPGYLPPRAIQFLDEASHRALLHKVGGGYMFIHRLLQEYLAAVPVGGRPSGHQ
jgi:hypothetical protein